MRTENDGKDREQRRRTAAGICSVVFYGGIFLFLLVFFTQVHPLLPFDMDDWSYLSYRRNAYPIWGDWNPSRVFPETFMALVSDAGVFALTPFLKLDYLHGQIAAHALTVSLFITVYVFLFRRFLKKRFRSGEGVSLLLSCLFLLLHFSVFRRERSANEHLFWTFNLTGYYYYILPNLLNASLVLWLLGTPEEERKKLTPAIRGIVCLLLYLSILSNLFPTVILMLWIGWELLETSLGMKKRGQLHFGSWLKEQGWRLAAILLWGVSVIYEANGGRAGTAGGMDIAGAAGRFASWGGRINLQTGGLFLLVIAGGAVVFLAKHKKIGLSSRGSAIAILFAIAAVISAVYEILLCAKVDPEKLELSRVIYPVCFYTFLCVLTVAERLIHAMPKTAILLAPVLYVLLINTRIGDRTFLDQNGTNLDGKRAILLTQYILDQVTEADASGCTEAVLHVPKQLQEDNWPHVYGLGSAMSQTLYRHGIVSRRIELTVLPDEAVNEAFFLEETDVDLSRGIRYNTLR